MDLNSPVVILVLLFIGSASGDYSDVRSDVDYSDEFNIFVQSFLAHLLSSDVFTKAEKEDLHAIVDTVGTVITAPRRRGTDLLRKMQIFNVAVITSIAETIGADSDQNPAKAKRKANAIAKALKSAFNTVSKDSSNNQQLISEVSSMVNMFSRLEEQENFNPNYFTTTASTNLSDNIESITDSNFPVRIPENQAAIPYTNSPIPSSNLNDDNINSFSIPAEKEQPPFSGDFIQRTPKTESTSSVPPVQGPSPISVSPKQDSINKEAPPNSRSPDEINWNFVFCIYNELFSAKEFTNVFTSNLPYEKALIYIQRISASLAKTVFFGKPTEYEISSVLNKALTFLNPIPTTEEFAYMFGQELSKMMNYRGMFENSNSCKLAATIADEITRNLIDPPSQTPEKDSAFKIGEKPPLPYLTTDPPLKGDLKMRRKLDFEQNLRTRLLSSEIFYTAFPTGIPYNKLTAYAFAVGSFLPATPEYRSLNISHLSTALRESLRAVESPAVANQYATAVVSVISSFMDKRGFLNDTNVDKQASRVGTIILKALCTQITTNFEICARKQLPRTRITPKSPNTPNTLLPSVNVGNEVSTQVNLPNTVYTSTIFNGVENEEKEPKNLATSTFFSNIANEQSTTITNPTTTDLDGSGTESFTGTETSTYETDRDSSFTYETNTDMTQTLGTDISDISTTELSQSNVGTVSEPGSTESTSMEYESGSEFSDECSTLSTEPSDTSEETATLEEQKEALITKLTEEIHRAEQSGTTEELVRTLTDFVTEIYTNYDEDSLQTISTETTTEASTSVASTQDTRTETGEITTQISTTPLEECDTTDTTLSEVTTFIPKDSISTTLSDSSTPTTINTSSDFSTESEISTTTDNQNIVESTSPVTRNRKNVSPLPKPPTWLFESALSYALLTSENFLALFKPGTSVSDAKSYTFKMAETVASMPQFDFKDGVFRLAHAYYSAIEKVQPNSTPDSYAKAFAKVTAEIAQEENVLTKLNQVPLAIATGNSIHDSLANEKPLKKKNETSNKPSADDETSASVENLLSSLSNSDGKTKKELLSKTLTDIGELIGDKDIQPQTLLIKLLMETMAAAVNVVISEKTQ